MQGERCYLTIVRWPGAMPEFERRSLLAQAAGLDPHGAGAVVARPAPTIACLLDIAVAAAVVGPLRHRGVIAIAPSDSTIDACSRRLAAKRLERADDDGTLVVHPWRGQGRILRAGEISLMVRARILLRSARADVAVPGHALSGAGGLYVSMDSDSQTSRAGRFVDALDLYDPHGAPVRIDGRKFSFDVLPQRGHSDKENIDRLCGLLLSLRAGAAMLPIDDGFARWRPPPHLLSHRSAPSVAPGTARTHDETPAFDFYSAWRFIAHCAEAQAERDGL
ncbi:MAG: hypothetical protein KIT68_01460 [Phycisphaeraceae bacterium]|nr:hypothetical protein [Phycisphaeraceae bacterium]